MSYPQEQSARMRSMASAEITQAAALLAKLKEEGHSNIQPIQELLVKASNAYREEYYYLAWEYGKQAREAGERIGQGASQQQSVPQQRTPPPVQQPYTQAPRQSSNQWQRGSQEVSKPRPTQQVQPPRSQAPQYVTTQQIPQEHSRTVHGYDGSTWKKESDKYSDKSQVFQQGRVHCPNCKTRIVPAEKFLGGYKCPVCGADISNTRG